MFKGSKDCVLLAAMIWLSGCDKPAPPPPPPPPAVTVTLPIEREIIDWDEYTGYLASPETANVSARVSGLILQAPFQEGAIVHRDDLLFVIDPRPFQADYDSKQAAVAQAQAQCDQAKVHFDRYAKVRGTQAISEDDYDAARAAYEQAQAALQAAKAAAENSHLSLDWTRVTAPITGRISRKDVTVGNLVTGGGMTGGAGQATLLTTIVSVDALYCYVNVPEDAFLKYHDLSEQERRAGTQNAKVPCYLQVGTESNFPHEGTIDFIDNNVDASTGTIQVRGVFPNPTGKLLPGLYARMRLPQTGKYHAMLIPAVAVNMEQNERFLLVVGNNNIVEHRKAELGRLYGQLQVVLSGLKPDERVIVNGLQSARPGAPVAPTEAPIPPADLKQLEALQATATGSPTTQALPETQPSAAPPASQPVQPAAGGSS